MKPFSYIAIFLGHCALSFTAVTNPCGIDDEMFANMPFFTGPLITPTAHTIPKGHFNFEPYLYVVSNYGIYNQNRRLKTGEHNTVVLAQFPVWVGLTDFMDISVMTQFNSRFKQDQASTQFGDVEALIEFQLLTDTPTNYFPAVKISISETFPTGKFENLDPSKSGTDVGGGGIYQTEIGLVASRMFAVTSCHYLSFRSALLYNFSPPSSVSGYHAYGGGLGTNGKVKVGDQIIWLGAFEYNFGAHWAIACDLEFLYQKKKSFSGKIGELPNGEPAMIGAPTSCQWSIAPAIEYNYNQHVGAVAGAWGSFAGKNAQAFLSGVLAINIYY